MREHLEQLLQQALQQLAAHHTIGPISISLERPRDPSHGDW